MSVSPYRHVTLAALAALSLGCAGSDAQPDSASGPPDRSSAGTAEAPATAAGEYALMRMGPSQPLPYEESSYTADCARVTIAGQLVLTDSTWSQRDSVFFRCPAGPEPDSVAVGSGRFRRSGDTLHLDVSRHGEQVEAEIAHLSGDTLETGLGISGSTPRLYLRVPRQ